MFVPTVTSSLYSNNNTRLSTKKIRRDIKLRTRQIVQFRKDIVVAPENVI